MEIIRIGILSITWKDLLDIGIVSFLIYEALAIFKGTAFVRLLSIILGVFILYELVVFFDLTLLKALLGQVLNVGLLGTLVIFSPEIRRFLILLTKNRFLDLLQRSFRWSSQDAIPHKEVLLAVEDLARNRVGAIIALQGSSPLSQIIDTGDMLNAAVSHRLILSIFQKNSPLHDGALIIHRNKMIAARCLLPMSENMNLPAQYGTRHRASLGLSEQSDSLVIIVSEETGNISVAWAGKIYYNLILSNLKNMIHTFQKEKTPIS
ncbi:MAG: diadenylate cyclase CdaA [Bacteroidia bacterium]|nr:diadenylate cyclase CdaA [Bacteroidia bacterium]